MSNPLVLRNVVVNDRRTSMRLEATMWSLLDEIAEREGLLIGEIVSIIELRTKDRWIEAVNLSSAVRIFVVEYYRSAATEEGHRFAGHGLGQPFEPQPTQASSTTPRAARRRSAAAGDAHL